MSVLKKGGFSSLCVFHRSLGSDDEAAGMQERAERLLYFFPRDIPVASQLKVVGLCEGVIDFVKTFNGDFSSQCVLLDRRRFAFLQPEPNLWMVLVIVNEVHAVPPATNFLASTDAKVESGRQKALKAVKASGASRSPLPLAPVTETTTAANVNDTTLIAVLQRMYDTFALFYGSVTRVISHPSARDYIKYIGDLRTKVRKLVDRRDMLINNYEALLARAAEEVTGGLSSSPTTATVLTQQPTSTTLHISSATSSLPMPSSRGHELEALAAEVHSVSSAAEEAHARLGEIQRFSPVLALRETLRNVLDFITHYIDWSCLSAFDAFGGVKYHQPDRKTAAHVRAAINALEMKVPLVQHAVALYDGYVISDGQPAPAAMEIVHFYLRLHAFHALRGTYVPDRRCLDFTSIAPVPIHARSKSFVQHVAVDAAQTAAGGEVLWSSAISALSQGRMDDAFREVAGIVKATVSSMHDGNLSAVVAGLTTACVGHRDSISSSTSVVPSTYPSALQSQSFYRGVKPTMLAVPALPAAAATRTCLKSVLTVPQEWPVLNMPYIAADFLASLSSLIEPIRDTGLAVSGAQCVVSTGCIGPSPPAKVTTASPASPATLPSTAQEADFVFSPAMFVLNTNDSVPSHRLLWFHHRLLTVLCYVDANGLTAAEKRLPAATVESIHRDVPVIPLQRVIMSVMEHNREYAVGLENALADSLNVSASTAAASGLETLKHVFIEEKTAGLRTHGYETVLRRPGKGRDALGLAVSQAAPVYSNNFFQETALHLHTLLANLGEEQGIRRGMPSHVQYGPLEWSGFPPLQPVPRPVPRISMMDMVALAASRRHAVLLESRKFRQPGDRSIIVVPPLEPAAIEQHILACRYDGGVALFRAGDIELYLTVDMKTPGMTDIDDMIQELVTKHSLRG